MPGVRQGGSTLWHHFAQVLWLKASCLTSLSLYFPFYKTVMLLSLLEGHSCMHGVRACQPSKMFPEFLFPAGLCLVPGHGVRSPHMTLVLMDLKVQSERRTFNMHIYE